MDIFLTGGTGFIGSYLVEQLVKDGYNLTCLVRPTSDIKRLVELDIDMVEGSVTDRESIRNAMKDVDMVMHFAAMYEIGKVDEKQMYNVNVVGTQNVFDLIQELEIPKSVYCSTEEALGHQDKVMTETSEHPGKFLSYYEETKHLAHKLWHKCCAEGLNTITVMPCGVIGPGDTKFTGQFVINYIKGNMPAIPMPDKKFTFVHVKDVVDGIKLAIEKGQPKESYLFGAYVKTIGEMFDMLEKFTGIPKPKRTSGKMMLKTYAILQEIKAAFTGKKPFIDRVVARFLADGGFVVDSSKAENQLGWKPMPFDEAMKDTVKWFMEVYGN
jgi:dihydroflavonol-4-reductase